MTQTYYNLLTVDGAAAFTNAAITGSMVALTHIAVGDGNGAPIEPNEAMTALVREVHRVPIRRIYVDDNNPNWLIAEALLPVDVGGWTIRELGAIGDGKLLTIGNYAPTYKPFLVEGTSKEVTIRMIIQVGNATQANLTIDPSVTTVSHSALSDILELYLTKTDADARYLQSMPIASTTVAGIVELATLTETRNGADGTRAVTPAGLKGIMADHGSAEDPHTQYAKAGDLAQHLLAADPHTQYLTQDELDAQFAAQQRGQRARRMFFASSF